MPSVIADYPDIHYLMVTLTIKNPKITELRKTIKWMQKAFIKMLERDSFCQLGYVRGVEVTRPEDAPDECHPHFHVLFAVPADYFDREKDLYISQRKLSELWQDAIGVDYIPVVDIRKINKNKKWDLENSVAEVVKYCSKPTDLVEDVDWTVEYMSQMLYVKRVVTGGIFQKYLKQIEEEPEDLIGKDERNDRPTGIFLYFMYDYRIRDYVLFEICEETLQNSENITQREYSTSVL
jgi:hypothetical protein